MEENPFPGICHQVVDRDKRRIENQKTGQFFRPSSAVEEDKIQGKYQKSPQQIGKVIGINDHKRQPVADKKARDAPQPTSF